MKSALLMLAFGCAFAAPAYAQQETNQLPRFEALETQQQTLEQNRVDNVETQRQRDLSRMTSQGASAAERGMRNLDYDRQIDRLRLQADIDREQQARERQIVDSALPNRRIAPYSSLVVADPGIYALPPAPPGQYYARLEGRFVLVDRTSELVVKVLETQPSDPTADAPLGARPPLRPGLPNSPGAN